MTRAGEPSRPSAGAPPAPVQLRVNSDPVNLAPVRHAVEQFCRDAGMGEAATADVGLCVNEALANVTRHAYGGATDRPVAVDAWGADGSVVVTIRDWGDAPAPPPLSSLKPPADPANDQAALKPGGLGLHCLRTLMDDVAFTPQPDGMLLTMKRKVAHE